MGVSTIIPNEYINNPVVKMSFYRRIADIETIEDKNSIEQELIKRFGKIDESVNNLLQIALIKVSCKKLNIQKLEKKGENIFIKFFNDKIHNSEKLIDYILKHPNEFKLSGNNILYLAFIFININYRFSLSLSKSVSKIQCFVLYNLFFQYNKIIVKIS